MNKEGKADKAVGFLLAPKTHSFLIKGLRGDLEGQGESAMVFNLA